MNKDQTCIRLLADPLQIKDCKKSLKANQVIFKQMTNLLALAGNEARLKIIFLLQKEQELCPCDLADILEMSPPAISQHLRKLKDGNVIEANRKGQTIFYSLRPEHHKLFDIFEYHANSK